jgi:hypothetical protein
MPFKSEAQRRKFYADPRLRKHAKKWEAHTPQGKLPSRLHPADKGKTKRGARKEALRRLARRKS